MSDEKRTGSGLGKTIVTALIAGLVGGGIAFGGYQLYQNNSGDNGAITTSSNKSGTTKVTNVNVKSSNETSKAFSKVENAVVSVISYTKSSSSSNSLTDIYGTAGDSSSTATESESSEGSGVIYKKSDGNAYVVTNNHVISGASKVEVLLSNGKKLSATVVGKDAVTDLAVLKISADSVTQIATFGDSDNITVGETALAIGSPLGSEYATSLTQGIISAKKRTIDVTNSSGIKTGQATVIQTDAAINPGNSGGPLINTSGQVVGINSMKLASTATESSAGSGTSSTSVEGMGFAIPSNEVVSIINQLVANGKVKRPALGISLIDLDYVSASDQKSVLKLPTSVNSGIVAVKINSDSPAKNAGIGKYDVIVKLDGKKVADTSSLREVLYAHKIGDTVAVEFYHNGKLQKANIKLTLEATDSNTGSDTASKSASSAQ
ncbi:MULTISPECIES: S1C family serine protease [Dellaglioa]|uniref:Serine protease HtrA n=2 Tax=Dellaglioa TaxID=2767880 RepID=A0A0R1HHG7_9LACO|nr:MULTISPECIES: trypsin-like peptidase domain-containing protein [Dellaglioa]KRK45846.1 serine protease HtrA [Dellaglioa algida DSM 15638]MCZ2491177.1 trypsin-like peptidase domain-containing protein [Dellaglioa carnosa]MCZ2493304.1 trypsin-like peptidase domain-containing protein [Dellaglioa carnosa]MCZ2494255.1 trypsin-like peptidase domain-containing protein [Dellaglioa carnosa]MDK1731329.1 trypsin-like peptidase domain-containing protein [Dellaglioa carnosa]